MNKKLEIDFDDDITFSTNINSIKISDIINDKEIGWEIEYEVKECVVDYLKINVEDKFGVVCHPNIIFQSKNK